MGRRLTVNISNLLSGDSDKVKWSVENPDIAKVSDEGLVFPEGAGETYVLATLINGKGAAKCKIIVVYENDDPYALDSHGIWVTSCMAVNLPGKYIGTAPEANYWLLRTEDQASELPIEEDYWVSAAEYADSVGVDIINSSLYYNTFHSFVDSRYRFEDMDGKTAFATKGANVAASKGILIVNCAGNDGTWVGTPADSPNVLTVGSLNYRLNIDHFTSFGVTIDGRMKPDVLAMGGGAVSSI